MSIVYVEVGRVTESLPAYAIFCKIIYIKKFLGHRRNFGPAATAPATPAPTALLLRASRSLS